LCAHLQTYIHVDIFYDWSTIISLLLRESDELISSALRSTQIAILLRIFVSSASFVTRKKSLFQSSSMQGSNVSSRLSTSKGTRKESEPWESLNENLQRSLPLLITRFKDDDANLSLLCMLLPFCDYSISDNPKAFKALLKVVADIFRSTTDAVIVHRVISAMRAWMLLGGGIVGEVESSCRELIQLSWLSIVRSSSSLGKAMAKLDETNKSKRRPSSGNAQVEREELMYTISYSFCKFRHFWSLIDCRSFFEVVSVYNMFF
jgi:hypothetical protein